MAVEYLVMDHIDRKIIAELQVDGRITATELSDRLPLSLSATTERLRRLQTSGVIRSFSVVVDPEAAGRPIEALIDVRLAPGSNYSTGIDDELRELDPVINAVHLTGRFDTQLHVAARDVAELDALLETLKERIGVEETNTRLVLRQSNGFPRPVQPVTD